jgi:predicted GNAT family acetyltransferase
LTMENAIKEAALLIKNGQLWIHRVGKSGEASEIASIVAITRESESVSAITKVFTNPKWRKLGCAERLVRCVCKK